MAGRSQREMLQAQPFDRNFMFVEWPQKFVSTLNQKNVMRQRGNTGLDGRVFWMNQILE
jgi:hypothetical protein